MKKKIKRVPINVKMPYMIKMKPSLLFGEKS
jgi:hypothetical protein